MERAPASIAWLFVFVGFRRVRATLVNAKIKILLTLTFFGGPGCRKASWAGIFQTIFRNESAPGTGIEPGSAAWQTRSLTTAPREEGSAKLSFPSLYIASADCALR